MQISEILKSLRKESNYTQKELAELLKIGQATIACYENGQREPQISSLKAYADFFDCSVDYIIGRETDYGKTISNGNDAYRLGLNMEEIELIEKYRNLDRNSRMKLLGYLDGIFKN